MRIVVFILLNIMYLKIESVSNDTRFPSQSSNRKTLPQVKILNFGYLRHSTAQFYRFLSLLTWLSEGLVRLVA